MQKRLLPFFLSLFAFLLVVTGGVMVMSLQTQLKVSQESRNQAASLQTAVVDASCKLGGCSSQACLDKDAPELFSTCEYRAEYACYGKSVCRVQANGHCGWTQTPELIACLGGVEASPTPEVSPTPVMSPTPSPTASSIVGDFNGDGQVNLLDYSILLNELLTVRSVYQADMNNDHKVDLLDYSLFMQRI